MVKINQKEGSQGKEGFLPTMWTHILKVKKDATPFQEGETVTCYIAEYDNKRFAVWDFSYQHHNKYKVFSFDELNDTFDES